jgi:hypothetical protein
LFISTCKCVKKNKRNCANNLWFVCSCESHNFL